MALPATLERWAGNMFGFAVEQTTGQQISDEKLATLESMNPQLTKYRDVQTMVGNAGNTLDPENAQRGRDSAAFVEMVATLVLPPLLEELGVLRTAGRAGAAVDEINAGHVKGPAPSEVLAPESAPVLSRLRKFLLQKAHSRKLSGYTGSKARRTPGF